jgi:hypothetical protein
VRLLLGLALVTACAPRAQPYRFASPMLGMADVPPESLARPAPPPPPTGTVTSRHGADVAVAPVHIASAAAADSVAPHGVVVSRLPAPNRIAAEAPLPAPREAPDLRALVGRRFKGDAFAQTLAWARSLGDSIDVPSGPALVSWAQESNRFVATAEPGDLLVFDQTEGAPVDLVAIAIARDERGVTEYIYIAGGAVRRGFLDPTHAAQRRDASGRVLNTFLRAGNRWPPRGTHYLAGELLAHVVRAR